MKTAWRTAWQGQDIIVFRNDTEVDRLASSRIERVLLVHKGSRESPGDLVRSVVDTGEDLLVFQAETGFAGRVNFEREAFWSERRCVYWVAESQAPLPWRWRRGAAWLGFGSPAFGRVPRSELERFIETWPLQGPQTWAQRKWRRIAKSRPFAPVDDRSLRA